MTQGFSWSRIEKREIKKIVHNVMTSVTRQAVTESFCTDVHTGTSVEAVWVQRAGSGDVGGAEDG